MHHQHRLRLWIAAVILLAQWIVPIAAVMFTNTDYSGISAGSPFTITWTDNEGTVTISLMDARDEANIQLVEQLTIFEEGNSFVWTPSDGLESGEYAFEIQDDSTGEFNYSLVWEYVSAETGNGSGDDSGSQSSPSPSPRTSSSSTPLPAPTSSTSSTSSISLTRSTSSTLTSSTPTPRATSPSIIPSSTSVAEEPSTTQGVTSIGPSSEPLSDTFSTSTTSSAPATSSAPLAEPTSNDSTGSALSTGAMAGIGAGGGIGGIILVAIFCWFFYRRGKQAANRRPSSVPDVGYPELGPSEPKPMPEMAGKPVSEMGGTALSEMDHSSARATTVQSTELPSPSSPSAGASGWQYHYPTDVAELGETRRNDAV
ncbi:hypothetical protein B0I35DRAFT_215513 [Stachybotrys elegans]|uniref:Yeast cell wall synthesis Kre9/Knh1-like N-terminal domain-containing protein n=1 Tax=Stachybotrys elegans TaxID=80388 RepID=A0A8K0WR48_9HYPO|nr:hypothetical protein B0I35DRAFT_215513 [Stachybotrys elegans]